MQQLLGSLLAVPFLAASLVLMDVEPHSAAQSSAPVDLESIDATMAAVRASAAEQRWRLIPFGHSLTKALTKGAEENRPVFFFGCDGELGSGNC